MASNNKRGRGRPKLIKTGNPGHLKKEYHKANVAINNLNNDPETIEEALTR